jgi:glycosyltransferase involved in cell wall biosynthesis
MMQQQPLVSILLPVRLKTDGFKVVNWLRQAIDSVFEASKGLAVELIIIDDESMPPLKEVLSDLMSDPRIVCLRNNRNIGLIRALNLGLTKARGRYIARIDADDRWRPNKLHAQLYAFELDPDLAISFGSMNLISDDEEQLEVHTRMFNWPETIEFAQKIGCPIPHGSILARTDLMKRVGGYPYEPLAIHSEDFRLWSRVLRFFKVSGLSEVVLDYRVHDKSVSSEFRSTQSQNTQGIMQAFRDYGPADDLMLAFSRLSKETGKSTLELGFLAYELWRFGGEISLHHSSLNELRRILFDRVLLISSKSGDERTVVVTEF